MRRLALLLALFASPALADDMTLLGVGHGGTALLGVGSWWLLFTSFNTGTAVVGCTPTGGTILTATTFSVSCSGAPSGAQDIYYAYSPQSSSDITAGIYDNITNSDGISNGRELQVNTTLVTSN